MGDYWALGVIMHIMLCGYSPWSDCTSEIQQRRCIVDKDVELIDEDWMHVTYQVKDLVLRLLHRNPKERATNDEILRITWNANKNHITSWNSWKNARSKLKKTVRSSFRARQCSTGTVEANIHLMKRVYASHKYPKKKNKQIVINHDDSKEERYLSPPPQGHKKHRKKSNKQKHKNKRKKSKITLAMSQSSTSATDEESDNFPQHVPKDIDSKPRKRKKSNHSSEPLNRNNYKHMVKYPDHEYRRRSRDDSELCNERLKLAAKCIERYIERKKREKKNADDSGDDSDAFPGVGTMSYRLFICRNCQNVFCSFDDSINFFPCFMICSFL